MIDVFKQHGAFSWVELLTDDVAAAKRFYSELLGWTLEDLPDMNYTLIKTGAAQIGGMMKMPQQAKGAPPHWGCYVTVDDVDATARRAEDMGAKLLVPPTDIPKVGRFCVLQDPQGATLSIITYKPM